MTLQVIATTAFFLFTIGANLQLIKTAALWTAYFTSVFAALGARGFLPEFSAIIAFEGSFPRTMASSLKDNTVPLDQSLGDLFPRAL